MLRLRTRLVRQSRLLRQSSCGRKSVSHRQFSETSQEETKKSKEEFEGAEVWYQQRKQDKGSDEDLNTAPGIEGLHPSQRYWKFAYKYWWLFGPTKTKRYMDSMEETGLRKPAGAGDDWTQPPSHWEPGMPVRPWRFDEIPPLEGPRPWQIWESTSYFMFLLPALIVLTFGVRHVRQHQAERDGMFYCINDELVEEHIKAGTVEESEKKAYRAFLDARTKDFFDERNHDFTYPRTRAPVSDSPLMSIFKGFVGMQKDPHLHQNPSELNDEEYKWLYHMYLKEDNGLDPVQAIQQTVGSDYVPDGLLLTQQQ